jgi:antitoxin CptB
MSKSPNTRTQPDHIDPLLKWHCRRGVLELDALLIPFYEDCAHQLTPLLKKQFSLILKEKDSTLTDWLLGDKPPNQQPAYHTLIQAIRNHRHTIKKEK